MISDKELLDLCTALEREGVLESEPTDQELQELCTVLEGVPDPGPEPTDQELQDLCTALEREGAPENAAELTAEELRKLRAILESKTSVVVGAQPIHPPVTAGPTIVTTPTSGGGYFTGVRPGTYAYPSSIEVDSKGRIVSITAGTAAGGGTWAQALAAGEESGGNDPTITAGDSLVALGDLPIVTGAFTTTYANATGDWTYPGSALYNSASPVVTIGDGTGSPTLILDKSDGGNATIRWAEGTDYWDARMNTGEDWVFIRTVGGVPQDQTTAAIATHNWTYPASATYNSASPVVTLGDGTGAPQLILNQSADEQGYFEIQNASGLVNRFYYGTGVPAGAVNNGDIYFRMGNIASTLWKRIGGAWVDVGGGAAETWAATLAAGAVSGGTNPTISNNDDLLCAVNLGSEIGATGAMFKRAFLSHQVGGVAVVGNANFTADDETFIDIDCPAGAGLNTITLPAAAVGWWYIIHANQTDTGRVMVDDQAGDTINGGGGPITIYNGATGAANNRSQWMVWAEDGTNWILKPMTDLTF